MLQPLHNSFTEVELGNKEHIEPHLGREGGAGREGVEGEREGGRGGGGTEGGGEGGAERGGVGGM